MISFRYHLGSLTAVFLALGLGLVIGASLADGGALAREQQAVITEIERRLGELRDENLRLAEALARQTEDMAYYDEAWTQVAVEWLGDALRDRTVTVFVHRHDSGKAAATQDILRILGARVTPVFFENTHEVDAAFVESLALFLLGGETSPAMEPLIAEGVLSPASTVPPDAVVVLGPPSASLVRDLSARLAERGKPAAAGIVGRPTDHWRDWPVPVVSYVETPAGGLRLASVLAEALHEEGSGQ